MSSKLVVRGALILSIAGIFSKVLSALYRVVLQNLTGDVGFYIYQQVYPFIGIIMILSFYGFPTAVAALTVEAVEKQETLSFRTFYGPIMFILFFICSGLFVLIYFSAPSIARIVGDVQLTKSLELIGLLLLFIPLLSLFRGVFQGIYQTDQVAISQMIEQMIRVYIIIIASVFVFNGKMDRYEIGEYASIASMVGMTAATLLLFIFYLRKRPALGKTYSRTTWKKYVTVILSLGLIASFNHLTLIFMQLADTLTLVFQLVSIGLEPLEAMTLKGVFDRGYPLVQFGIVFGSSFALALIPAVASHRKNIEDTKFKEALEDAVTLCIYIAAGATVGLIVLFPEVNLLLFNANRGTLSLRILSGATLFTSLSIIGCTILQNIGSKFEPALWIFAAFVVKLLLNVILIPYFSITGSALATLFSLILLSTIVFYRIYTFLSSVTLFKVVHIKFMMIASFGMTLYLVVIKKLSTFFFADFSRSGLFVYVIFLVITGVCIYVGILIRYGAISTRQLQTFPFQTYFISLAEKIRKEK